MGKYLVLVFDDVHHNDLIHTVIYESRDEVIRYIDELTDMCRSCEEPIPYFRIIHL